MNHEISTTNPHLQPHKYPNWVIAFAIAVLMALAYSLYFVPNYIIAAKKLEAGEAAFANKNYSAAIQFYESVLKIVSSSKKARLSIAEAYFSNDDKSDDERGLQYLYIAS